ncbi:MAG: hypothetical protein P8Y97_00400 [Candidatus Lokiarchaeota archaeon]
MRLEYLPLTIFNVSSQTYEAITYQIEDNFIYLHKATNKWFKNFRIVTKPTPTSLEMVDFETDNEMVVFQKHYESRTYQYTFNPLDAMEKGEEYTYVQIDTLYKNTYHFTFKLTDKVFGAGIPNKAVWLQIGFVPKSETEFMNPSLELEDGTNPYYESIGTDSLTWIGPGVAPNKMYNRPLLYNLAQQDENTTLYGPYIWAYAITDNFGKVTFEITFDEEYLDQFQRIFGKSVNSIEEISLYIRAFSSMFDWDDFALNQLDYTLCSESENIFTGKNIIENYDFVDQIKFDSTYLEGIIRLHKHDTALGLYDHLKYELPTYNITTNSTAQFSPLNLKIRLTEANQIPSEDKSLDNLLCLHTSDELEATGISILSEKTPTHVILEFINGSDGEVVHKMYSEVNISDNLGEIFINNKTMVEIISKLGPGMHSIRIQAIESEFYKQSPSVIVPFEVVPPNNMKFGEKLTNLDLIEPFISTWGTVYNDEEEAPFESNYPALLGTIWIDPDFLGSGEEREEKERSINDYVKTSVDCTLYNDNGTTSTFELSNVMLRPGNRDGIYTITHAFGPEGEFLMGLDFALNVSFNIDSSKDSIFEDHRQLDIKVLDLRIEENPSSSNPTTLWSIADNQFTSSYQDLTVLTSDDITINSGEVHLGGLENGEVYGVEILYYYDNETNEYYISENHPYLDLKYLTDIEPKAVFGELNHEEHEFIQGPDWEVPFQDINSFGFANCSMINFTNNGDKPDNLEEFTVIYDFTFNIPNYAISKLGYFNNKNFSWVWINFSNGFIKESNKSLAPMYIKYTDTIEGDGITNTFVLNYSISGISQFKDNFIIYNEQELEQKYSSITKDISQGFAEISFTGQVPDENFTIIYGVKSPYDLHYGFQKDGKPISDSVRLIRNSESSNPIIHKEEEINTIELNSPDLYIGLDNSPAPTTLQIQSIPLLYTPEINISFVLDPIIINQIQQFSCPSNLEIQFEFITNDGSYSYVTDPLQINLDYAQLQGELRSDGSYVFSFDKDLQSIYDVMGPDNFDMKIILSQTGKENNYISYLIISKIDYLCDDHILEMYDTLPTKDGDVDYGAIMGTNHILSVTSSNFFEDPFNLLHDSEVTVGLSDLPNSSLVQFGNEGFNDLGSSETYQLSASNPYGFNNLGMFTDLYNLDEEVIQDGYIDLYYGDSTEINGERYYTNIYDMVDKDGYGDHMSYVEDIEDSEGNDDLLPISWQNEFEITSKFLTTSNIEVEGTVLYHYYFDVYEDTLDEEEINNIFPEWDGERILFGVQLPESLDIAEILGVGAPRNFQFSVHGFPIGPNAESNFYLSRSGLSGNYGSLYEDDNVRYSYETLSNGSSYLLFHNSKNDVNWYIGDNDNLVLVDLYAYHTFEQGKEYEIIEDPTDPYISKIKWDYSYHSFTDYNLHPDFSDNEPQFTIKFPALEWSQAKDIYINDVVDNFKFRPEESKNISIFYLKDVKNDTISLEYVIPEDHYDHPEILKNIYGVIRPIGDRYNEELELFKFPDWAYLYYLEQNVTALYEFTVLFDELRNDVPTGYEIVPDSYLYLEAVYNSSQLRYRLQAHPFNYEFLDLGNTEFQVSLSINGGDPILSSDPEFSSYVEDIENRYIYFRNDTDIAHQSDIEISYKAKMQPGLLERKHLMIIAKPWSNTFDTVANDVESNNTIYRERYRKLGGGSIISPFEYSLSIEDTYSLYLSYSLNQKQYYEEKFKIEYGKPYTYNYLNGEVDNYASELEKDGQLAITVFYFDEVNKFNVLDHKFYSIDSIHHNITLIKKLVNGKDTNPLTAVNNIDEFYVSFLPKTSNVEFSSYKFSFNPEENITETLNVNNWRLLGAEGDDLDILPNLNAHYYLDESVSTETNTVCYASQLATYIKEGQSIEFNLMNELDGYLDNEVKNGILNGNYLSLFIETQMENPESLEYLKITLINSQGIVFNDLTKIVTREELELWDNELKIDLPTQPNPLQKIRVTPYFRNDGEYTANNPIGTSHFEYITFSNESLTVNVLGQRVFEYTLEHPMLTDLEDYGYDFAYVFDDNLRHLTFQDNYDLSYNISQDPYTKQDQYDLQIPLEYIDPITNETVMRFQNGDLIGIRYNRPVEKGISIGIGKLYFQKKPTSYNPAVPSAECLLINTDSSEDYSQFTNEYYYSIPLRVTPFDTEYSNSYKSAKFDINLSVFQDYAVNGSIDFSNITFTINDPSYELTINEILLMQNIEEPSAEQDSVTERVWQYIESQIFRASATPEEDEYQLEFGSDPLPLFYPNEKWIEYINVYDEDDNYYSVGIEGDDYQLLYELSNNTLRWSTYFDLEENSEFGTPKEIIDPNTTLYIEYATNMSWNAPITLDQENVDLQSISAVYDNQYLLKPDYYDWYQDKVGSLDYNYQTILYSFKEDSEYKVTQYYQDSFTVYETTDTYVYSFDFNYSLVDDFINVSLYKIIGVTPDFNYEIFENDNIHYAINFDLNSKQITIIDKNSEDGVLNKFDYITIILNYSYGPISSYSRISLLDTFNETYLFNPEHSFYTDIEFDFSYLEDSGEILLYEDSEILTSNETTFTPIDYTRNSIISENSHLKNYQSSLYDKFIIYYDDSDIIYEADIDFDGVKDYKETIDVDKNGIIDVIKYGVEDEDSGQIIWYTIIQSYTSTEKYYDKSSEPEVRTEWFDIDDRTFAQVEWNLVSLLMCILCFPILQYTLTSMIIPPIDYWAQKSIISSTLKETEVINTYYSIKVDKDKDGLADKQIDYESQEVTTTQTVQSTQKVIMAAKLKNIFTIVGEFIARSIESLISGNTQDVVFNGQLTEEKLDRKDFSSCNWYVRAQSEILKATYRKFLQTTEVKYRDEYKEESVTIIEYNEGEIAERRIYSDQFDEGFSSQTKLSDLFSGIMNTHRVTDVSTDEELTISFDPELPFTDPSNISYGNYDILDQDYGNNIPKYISYENVKLWGQQYGDNIPKKYDSLRIISENEDFTTNCYEKEIILQIPNRYSLYNDYGKLLESSAKDDGIAEFKIKGILLTPQDGKVYYTSDKNAFMSGNAKIKGHYFYVDSDGNNFYETTYILAPSKEERNGVPVYYVMSIAFNYDGKHEIVPYEKVSQQKIIRSDFNKLSRIAPLRIGPDWLPRWTYRFGRLQNNKWIFPQSSQEDLYRQQDSIFEIYKTVKPSKYNSRLSELFYKVRHETYNNAYHAYRNQFVRDVAEQVFMTVTASILSTTVYGIVWGAIMVSTLGLGWVAAEIAGRVAAWFTYFGVYTLMTKFFGDIKNREAQAYVTAQTYYPVETGRKDPINLNNKLWSDKLLGDGMLSGLIGHPNAFYRTARGGNPGEEYTAQVLVTPPNPLRTVLALSPFGTSGFISLLAVNMLTFGLTNPDLMIGLDFDHANLDYLLLTSELPSYNRKVNTVYANTNNIFNQYDWYSLNTYGYLEKRIAQASGYELNTLRPVTINGVPEYRFIDTQQYLSMAHSDLKVEGQDDAKLNSLTQPDFGLYNPVVLNEGRYNALSFLGVTSPGHLVVKVRSNEFPKTSGYNPNSLNKAERTYYSAKIPLENHEFNYPIKSIYVDVIKDSKVFASHININNSIFEFQDGNLYFTQPLESSLKAASSKYKTLSLKEGDSSVSYNVHIIFDRFITDTTEETKRIALAQATHYTLLDYFNQYTYAGKTAGAIAEIAYTETMTFWSTVISSVALNWGSLTTGGLRGFLTTLDKTVVKNALKEVKQEIITDSIIETFVENGLNMLGVKQDLIMWASSLATSARESMSDFIRSGGSIKNYIKNLKAKHAQIISEMGGDINQLSLEERKLAAKMASEQLRMDNLNAEAKQGWIKNINNNILRGIAMLGKSFLLGGFTLTGLTALKMGEKVLCDKITQFQNRWKNRIPATYPVTKVFQNNLETSKPGTISGDQINELFRNKGVDLQNIQRVPSISPKGSYQAREDLASKFGEIRKNELYKYKPSIQSIINQFQSLYPEGYQGFTDPILGAIHWGMDNGIDVSALTLWGGQRNLDEYVATKAREQNIAQTRENQEALQRMHDWNTNILHEQTFEPLTIEGKTTVKALKETLNLHELDRGVGIYVNLKIASDTTIINPKDIIFITPRPYKNTLINAKFIEKIINPILKEIKSNSRNLEKIDNYQYKQNIIVQYWEVSKGALYSDSEIQRNVLKFGDSYTTSLYHPHALLFRQILLNKLYGYRLLDVKTFSELREKVGKRISKIDKFLTANNDQLPSHGTLYVIFSQVRRLIMDRIIDLDRRNSMINEFEDFFDTQFKIYGLLPNNKLSHLGYKTIYGWIELLKESRIPSARFWSSYALSKLANVIGLNDAYFVEKFSRIDRGVQDDMKSATIKNWKKNLYDYVKTQPGVSDSLLADLKEKIDFLSSEFLSYVQNFELGSGSILQTLMLREKEFPNSPKVRFLRQIVSIMNCEDLDVSIFSKLIFGDENYVFKIFLMPATIYSRINVNILYRINYLVSKWTIFDLNSQILNENIFLLKDDVTFYIDEWIRSNPFSKRYFIENDPKYDENFGINMKLFEHSMMQDIFSIFASILNSEKITIGLISSLVGSDIDLTNLKHKNRLLNQPSIESVYKFLKAKRGSTLDVFLQIQIDQVLSTIEDYLFIRERGLKLSREKTRLESEKANFDVQLDFLNNPPTNLILLRNYLSIIKSLKGAFPSDIWNKYYTVDEYSISDLSKTPYTTKFKKELYSEHFKEYKDAVIDIFKDNAKTREIKDVIKILRQVCEIANRKDFPKKWDTKSNDGGPHHDYVIPEAFNLLKDVVIAREVPILWKDEKTGIFLHGHIDLLIRIGNTIYIGEYKPDLDFNLDSKNIGQHFIDSIPQASSYAIIFKKMFAKMIRQSGLEVKGFTFRKDAGYIFDPEETLGIFTDFYKEQRPNDPLPWGGLLSN